MNRKVSKDSYGKLLVHYSKRKCQWCQFCLAFADFLFMEYISVLNRLEIGKHTLVANILGVLLATLDSKSLSVKVVDVCGD